MTAQEIRKKYLDFFKAQGHKVLPRASLVPQDDPTTLFTGSGMQPLIPYLLGQPHPEGQRLVDSQTCFRAEDMDEVGDNRHTTFFEMLGNWSLGNYFKEQQLPWCWEFLTNEIGLDPKKLYVTCFFGDDSVGVAKDTQSGKIWKNLFTEALIDAKEVDLPGDTAARRGMQGGRIFYYDARYNWWSREGEPSHMREGEPGGPDSEVFYEFTDVQHDKKFGENCHPNCECGRFLEIANSVFMTYRKVGGKFEELPKPNVDFGGGLERIAAAGINSPDIFQISLIKPVIEGLEKLSGKNYDAYQASMRVIADHIRAATWLAVDGVEPSNKERGYVLRRLLRRAIRYGLDLGIEQDLLRRVVPIVTEIYGPDFPEVAMNENKIIDLFIQEEKLFRQTLRNGLKEFKKLSKLGFREKKGISTELEAHQVIPGKPVEYATAVDGPLLTGEDIFKLYDTYGFPVELSIEEAQKQGVELDRNWHEQFDNRMHEQKHRSQTASVGMFKGGLADTSEETVKLHTVTHLMYQALKDVLGSHVIQRGSNITAERTRFDFSHPQKVTPDEIKKIEDIVNQKISEDLSVSWQEEPTEQALKTASGAFGEKYGDKVKVYTIGSKNKPFSREICGGPHVEHTGRIGEGGKKFKIVKEESVAAGVRRVKAVLE